MVTVRPKTGAQMSGSGYQLTFDGEKWTGTSPTGAKITPRGEMQTKLTQRWFAQQKKKAATTVEPEEDEAAGTEAVMDKVQAMVGQDNLHKAIQLGEQLVSKGNIGRLTQLERLGLAILVARKKVRI